MIRYVMDHLIKRYGVAAGSFYFFGSIFVLGVAAGHEVVAYMIRPPDAVVETEQLTHDLEIRTDEARKWRENVERQRRINDVLTRTNVDNMILLRQCRAQGAQ